MFLRNLRIHGDGKLTDETLSKLVQALIFDKKVTEVESRGEKLYKPSNWYTPRLAFGMTPCAHCKHARVCAPGNLISPESCEYLEDW